MRFAMTVAAATAALAAMAPPASRPALSLVSTASGRWHVEHDVSSVATLGVADSGVRLDFQLGAGRPANQFAAAVVALPAPLTGFAAVTVTARADRPMRIAIQLRDRDERGARRWRRTMYVGSDTRSEAFELATFTPVGAGAPSPPPAGTVAALMIGVDTMNTRPGVRAQLAIEDVRLVR